MTKFETFRVALQFFILLLSHTLHTTSRGLGAVRAAQHLKNADLLLPVLRQTARYATAYTVISCIVFTAFVILLQIFLLQYRCLFQSLIQVFSICIFL